MKDLELLKNHWGKSESQYPKLSKEDIYKLILKKYSSIVKWIFIISMLEFDFWTITSFLLKDHDAVKEVKAYEIDTILMPLIVLGYIVLAYFFYRFYTNYRTISTTDSVKVLMRNILKTRQTVKHYVIFNLVYLYISIIISIFIQLVHNPDLLQKTQEIEAEGGLTIFYIIIAITTLVAMVIITLVLIGFYFLVYGLLLKRLKKNYKELKLLETET